MRYFGGKGTKTIDTLGNKSDKNEFQRSSWGKITCSSEFVMKRIANPQVQYGRIANLSERAKMQKVLRRD
jgi:hypothetical protein